MSLSAVIRGTTQVSKGELTEHVAYLTLGARESREVVH